MFPPKRNEGSDNHIVERRAGRAGSLPCEAGAPSNIITYRRARAASRRRAGRRASSGGLAPPNGGLAKNEDVVFRGIINFVNITYNSGQMAS